MYDPNTGAQVSPAVYADMIYSFGVATLTEYFGSTQPNVFCLATYREAGTDWFGNPTPAGYVANTPAMKYEVVATSATSGTIHLTGVEPDMNTIDQNGVASAFVESDYGEAYYKDYTGTTVSIDFNGNGNWIECTLVDSNSTFTSVRYSQM